jgi:hypothetical protein
MPDFSKMFPFKGNAFCPECRCTVSKLTEQGICLDCEDIARQAVLKKAFPPKQSSGARVKPESPKPGPGIEEKRPYWDRD